MYIEMLSALFLPFLGTAVGAGFVFLPLTFRFIYDKIYMYK